MMPISGDLYRVFLAVARTQSFTRAAEGLFVSQSAVSQSIRLLEQQLGLPLFIRSGRKTLLSEAGQVLLPYVERAFANLEGGQTALSALRSMESGHVRIGASDTLSRRVLLNPLQQFHTLYPKIHITTMNRPSSVCMQLLERQELDFAIVNVAPDTPLTQFNAYALGEVKNRFMVSAFYLKNRMQQILPEDLDITTPMPNAVSASGLKSDVGSPDPFVSMASGLKPDAGSPDVPALAVSMAILKAYPWITLEEAATTRRVLDRWLAHQGIQKKPEFEFGSNDLVLEMVKRHMGIGFINEPEDLKASAGLVILEPELPIPTLAVTVLTSAGIPLSKAASCFLKEICPLSD